VVTTPEHLFVFVGAGASVSVPSCRPVFNSVRDEVLVQLSLAEYAAGSSRGDPELVAVAAALAPEPFMLELTKADVDVQGWLEEVLGGGEPNAAHVALARLAANGAKVWTVNFDTLIERADPSLTTSAWPEEPGDGAHVKKPHGTLGGPLIVTSEQVLRGLDVAWERQLREDVRGRVAVFLGYSGRDLDFQPLWNDVLSHAERVMWFGRPHSDDEARHRLLLRDVDATGKLAFPSAASPPAGVPARSVNPSWDFVSWCLQERMVDSHPDLESRLFERLPTFSYPPLKGRRDAASAAVLGLLGDYRRARSAYLRLLREPSERKDAARSLGNVALNQAGTPLALALGLARVAPAAGRLKGVRESVERKRLTILSKTGAHAAVLRGTRNYDEKTISTILILRSESLRITGSLDEAADLAEEARRRALFEKHPVRVAHASFQRAMALLWAERIDEARESLDDELTPYAAVAANRWIGWADFIRGALAVRAGDAGDALRVFELSWSRFAAERLVDGLVSVDVARLAALRLAGKEDEFRNAAAAVADLVAKGERGKTFYAKAHQFTKESIVLERAEFARVHEHNLTQALNVYKDVANSRYPLHRAHALVGLSLVELEEGRAQTRASEALAVAEPIGARLFVKLAERVLGAPAGVRLPEVFFC
jgi:hypothetical protein